MEVEAVLSGVLDQQDSIVYGVEVPGAEGRAGMAAIVEPEGGLDLKQFLQAVKHQLPSYAVPLFVRIVEEVDLTGRFASCYTVATTQATQGGGQNYRFWEFHILATCTWSQPNAI